MEALIITLGIVALTVLLIFLFAPRPKLKASVPKTRIPPNLNLQALDQWIEEEEHKVDSIVPGAEATIQWANPNQPAKTPLSFLYIHGFSATRQETAPVTHRLAQAFSANAYHARLAGHGTGSHGMLTTSELWLHSVADAFEIASRLGDKVVVVATSTGAPLTIWLTEQTSVKDKLHALLFMSPNFKIKNPFGFLLTWPWSPKWIQKILGNEISWQPESEAEGKYWTSQYSTLALIEMQKVVDWYKRVDLSKHKIPLATMYMKNDSTIDARAAVAGHNAWGSDKKKLIQVEIDGENEEHVFVGDITAPHRVDWCVESFSEFLRSIQ